MDLSKCQIFTPPHIVKYMLDKIDYNCNIFGKRIIDNSCGTGNILVEVVERFILDAKRQKKRKATIKRALETCIYGYDVDLYMVQNCINNLNNVAQKFNIAEVNWNIQQSDGLAINGNFDYVVGNPPYISYLDLDSELRIKTKENFQSCSIGKFDYSYAFIEKGLSLLVANGRMVMLTPSNMFKTVFGEKLRNIIKQELTEIIDCSTLDMFNGVLTSPAITVFQKGNNSDLLIYRDKYLDCSETEMFIDKNNLSGKWDFSGFVANGSRRFGDYFKVSNSIATLANKIFIHTIKEDGSMEIEVEPTILRTAKSPKTEQYNIKQKIIFPYQYTNGKLVRYEEEVFSNQYPMAYAYLDSKKEKLDARDSDDKAKWYEYGRSQALAHLNCEKLLMSTIITRRVRLYRLTAEEIPYSGLYITPIANMPLDTAITILQSQHFYSYLVSKGVKERGVSIRISSKDVEEFQF